MLRFCHLLMGVTLLTHSAGVLFAQPAPAEVPQATFRINARTVIEDVVVMDKDGRAVSGLHKNDFQIFENGKPQAITFFEPDFAVSEAATTLRAALPPDTFTNVVAAPPNNVTNVLLLDALNTRSTERMYAQVQMVKYLASLPPNMRIAVFTLDNEKFHLIWGFNEDSSALRAAIAKFTGRRSHSASSSPAAQREAERRELGESVDAVKQRAYQSGDDRLGENADALLHFLKHGTGIIDEYNNVFTTWVALEALGRYLAGIPGRKNLFWLAGTFPHQFKSDPFFDWYLRAKEKLAESEVSVYPIDANGVDVDTGGVLPPDSMPESVLRYEDTEGWAEETGGKAYHGNDIHREIADAADHGSRYYRLAYVPSDTREEGRERKVEIKVLSGDYKLFYRKRYFEQTRTEIAKTKAASLRDPLIALMGRGMPNIGELPYRLKVVKASTQPNAGTPRAGANAQLSGNLTRYDMVFQLLPSGFSSLRTDADGARRERLEVMVMVYSQDAKPLNWQSYTTNIKIKPGQWAKALTEGVSFRFQIDAPAGDVYLRTGVYDAVQSRVGTLEIPLSAVKLSRKGD